jgi:hypothetical protein
LLKTPAYGPDVGNRKGLQLPNTLMSQEKFFGKGT